MNLPYHIPSPCSEDWNNMLPNEKGRFCNSCQKNVIDFTNKSNEEIGQYLKEHIQNGVCGRMRVSQFQSHKYFQSLTFKETLNNKHKHRFQYSCIALGSLLILACSQHQNTNIKTTVTKTEINQNDSSKIDSITLNNGDTDSVKIATTATEEKNNQTIKKHRSHKHDDEIVAGLMISDGDFEPNQSYDDSLYQFIANNLEYPQWEKENKIQGEIIASFTLHNDGSISDITIEKTIVGGKKFETEVIRVLSIVPKYETGMKLYTTTKCTIPIAFELD
jgi:TonB family protein